MTDLELEKRLAYAEHNIDRLYIHVLFLSGFLLGVVLVFITTLFF